MCSYLNNFTITNIASIAGSTLNIPGHTKAVRMVRIMQVAVRCRVIWPARMISSYDQSNVYSLVNRHLHACMHAFHFAIVYMCHTELMSGFVTLYYDNI